MKSDKTSNASRAAQGNPTLAATEAEPSAAEVLSKAADLIAAPGAWTKNALARTKRGNPIGPLERNAVCWCVSGAIGRAAGGDEKVWDAAFGYLDMVLSWTSVPFWNDQAERTQAEAVAALREAAGLANTDTSDLAIAGASQ